MLVFSYILPLFCLKFAGANDSMTSTIIGTVVLYYETSSLTDIIILVLLTNTSRLSLAHKTGSKICVNLKVLCVTKINLILICRLPVSYS